MDRVARLPEAERRELFTETANQWGMTPGIVEHEALVSCRDAMCYGNGADQQRKHDREQIPTEQSIHP